MPAAAAVAMATVPAELLPVVVKWLALLNVEGGGLGWGTEGRGGGGGGRWRDGVGVEEQLEREADERLFLFVCLLCYYVVVEGFAAVVNAAFLVV